MHVHSLRRQHLQRDGHDLLCVPVRQHELVGSVFLHLQRRLLHSGIGRLPRLHGCVEERPWMGVGWVR